MRGFLLKKGAESSIKLLVVGIAPLVEGSVLDVLEVSAGRPIPPDRVEEAPALKLINELLSRKVKTSMPS